MAMVSWEESRWLRWTAYICVAMASALAYLSAFGHTRIALGNDHKILLSCARRMLEGMVPYVEWVDINPPMIVMLYSVPVLASNWLGLPLMTALNLYALFWVALSLIIMWAMLAGSGTPRYVSAPAVSFSALAMLGLSFMHQAFADREHLMLVMTMPFLLLYSPLVDRGQVGVRWRMAASLLAGIGFAIKPSFYLFYMALLTFRLSGSESAGQLLRQREQRVVVVIGLLYLLVLFTCFRQWPLTILPLGLKAYASIDWAMRLKITFMLESVIRQYLFVPLIIAMAIWYNHRSYHQPLVSYLLWLLLAAVLHYFLNGGWGYTAYPFTAFAFLLTIAITCQLLGAAMVFLQNYRRKAACMAILAGALAMISHAYAWPAAMQWLEDAYSTQQRGTTASASQLQSDAEHELYAYLKKYPRFIFISTDYWPVNFESEGSPVRNVSRLDHMWFLPGILKLRQIPKGWQDAEHMMLYLSDGLADDIEKHRPGVVISDVSKYRRALPDDYNAIADFKTNKRFARAFEDYYLADRINACSQSYRTLCAFDIYMRKH